MGDIVATTLGFIFVSLMSIGAFFMCYLIINDWFINSKKKKKLKMKNLAFHHYYV